MLWSKLFISTLRENPAEAEAASHQLPLRAGVAGKFRKAIDKVFAAAVWARE